MKYLFIISVFLFTNFVFAKKECTIDISKVDRYDEGTETICNTEGVYCGEIYDKCQDNTETYKNCLNFSKHIYDEITNSIMNKTIIVQDLLKNGDLKKLYMQVQTNVFGVKFEGIKNECVKYKKDTTKCIIKDNYTTHNGGPGFKYTNNYDKIKKDLENKNFKCASKNIHIDTKYEYCMKYGYTNKYGHNEPNELGCCLVSNNSNQCDTSIRPGV